MTVVSEGPLSLRIHLNKYELKKHFVSYDKISFTDPEVKKTIDYLFVLASAGLHFETAAKRIIEVFPSLSGGCIIKFTAEPNLHTAKTDEIKNLRLKKTDPKTIKYIFGFNSSETLLRLIQCLYKKENVKQYKSEILKSKINYFLKINIPIFDRNTPMLINEYSIFSASGSIAIGVIKEHSDLIASPYAIDEVGKYFIN